MVCLIFYSLFQFYQTYSSIKLVFFDSPAYYSTKPGIQILAILHAIGYCTSSVCLLIGAFKKKIVFLIFAQIFLLYKLVFCSWQFYDSFDVTIGCDERHEECDPGRLALFYKHCLIFGEHFRIYIFFYILINHFIQATWCSHSHKRS